MKELTIEQKAKLYDEAIKRGKAMIPVAANQEEIYNSVITIFPELKESEDGQNRKWILEYLYDGLRKSDEQFKGQFKSAIAWLEKQGEHSVSHLFTFEDVLTIQCAMAYAKFQDRELDVALKKLHDKVYDAYHDSKNHHIESQDGLKGEQKSTDKIEPKFKVGDIIERKHNSDINKFGHFTITDIFENCYWYNDAIICDISEQDEWEISKFKTNFDFKVGQWIVATGKCIYCITKIDGFNVTLVDVDNNEYVFDVSSLNDTRLWTIQDANDGDVLACKGNVKNSNGIKYERICLFNNLDNAFFTLTKLSNFVEEYDIDIKIDYPDNTVPATKEQKEILFMTMANVGYTFDFDKKELKKVEQKPTWSEYDCMMIESIIQTLEIIGDKGANRMKIDFLKSLKDRVLPQPKQEWSEEDERSIRDSIFYLKSAKKYFEKDDDTLWDEKWFNMCIEWLESLYKMLRPQSTFKPSEEEIKALEFCIEHNIDKDGVFGSKVVKLYEKMKKLREE